ncbi:MAG: hypothetical protein ACWGNO_04555 [Desulfobacterales bacterium]
MALNLRHKNWERTCREFEILDEHGQPNGQIAKVWGAGQKNIDLGNGNFAPYVWDAPSQSIRYGDLVCEFHPSGYQVIREYGSVESLIDDQRFELQYFREQGSKWNVLDLYNITLQVNQQDDHCIITRRMDDEGGGNWLEVDFLFRPHHTVKLTYRLHVANADQYRIRFQNTGIAGEVIEQQAIDFDTGDPLGVYRLLFDSIFFSWQSDEIAIHEGYTIEDQAGGKKLDFFLGDFDLPAGGDVVISPTTFGPQETSDDCVQSGSSYNDNVTGQLGIGYAGSAWNTGWIWSNVTVPDGSTLGDGCKITVEATASAGNGADSDCWLRAVDESPVPAWSASELPTGKSVYGTDVVFSLDQASGSHDSPELKTVLQQVIDDVDWSSGNNIGLVWIDDSPTPGNYQAITAEESGTGATLTIVYTEAAGTTVQTDDDGKLSEYQKLKQISKVGVFGAIF